MYDEVDTYDKFLAEWRADAEAFNAAVNEQVANGPDETLPEPITPPEPELPEDVQA